MFRLAVVVLAIAGLAFGAKDEVCATCHRAIYESYETTPVARSSGSVTAEQAPSDSGQAFEAAGANFRIGPDAAVEITADGSLAAHRLRYYIGAGVTGRSFLYDIDKYLFQSPVAWVFCGPPVEPFTWLRKIRARESHATR